MRSTTKPALLAAALVLLGGLAACSDDDDDGSNPLAGDQAGADEQTDGEESGGGQGSGSSRDAESLGSSEASLENLDEDNVPLRIDVVRLERNGDLVELGLVLTNEAEPVDDDSMSWEPNTDFGGGPGINGNYDTRELAIVDPDGQRKYLPALDDQGVCLCSGTGGSEGVSPGESMNIDASIGGLPEDVDVVDVHVPGFPPITGIEVRG